MLKQLLTQERLQRTWKSRPASADRPAACRLIEQIKQEAANTIEALKQKHEADVDALLRRFYGPKSERFDPRATAALRAGDGFAAGGPGRRGSRKPARPLKTRRIQHKHGRAKLPEALPRIPIEHDLKPEEKLCPCCGLERCRIGKEVTEQLEYFPASFKVLQHIRYKYACKPCAGVRQVRRQRPADRTIGRRSPPSPSRRAWPGRACWPT